MRTWMLVVGICLVSSLSACSTPPVVIPDSRELRPAYTQEGQLDPGRATIDLGYLREIVEILDRCGSPSR